MMFGATWPQCACRRHQHSWRFLSKMRFARTPRGTGLATLCSAASYNKGALMVRGKELVIRVA